MRGYQACSMLMTLHCYHLWDRGCSSYWIPCSPSMSSTGLQSVSQRRRWWCLVGATNSANGMSGPITSSVVNLSFIWACCFMRTDTSSMRFSIAWLEAMRLRGLSSHGILGLAVQILSSSFCDCNRQSCSLVPAMPVRCELQPQLALGRSEIHSSSRGPSSAELAVPRKVFLWTAYFRSCNR